MNDKNKTKEQHTDEVMELRRRVAELEESAAEQKKATEALQERNEQLEILFEYAPDAYYVNDLKGVFIDGNKAAEEATGYKKDELIGKSFLRLKLLSPAQLPKAAQGLARNALGQPTRAEEYTLSRKDGSQLTVEIRTFPTKIGGRRLVLGIARDITERKRMEEELRESEEKYRALIENANEGITVTQGGMIMFANPKEEEISGYSEAELTARPFVDFIHPDDQKMVMERYQKRLKGAGVPSTYPFRIVDKDGNTKWIEINTVLIDWEEKPATLNFITDITERKQMEQELRKSEHFARTVISSIGEGFIVYDREMRCKARNEFMEDITGIPSEKIIEEPALDLFPHLKEQGVDRLLEQALAGNVVRSDDIFYHVPATGKNGWVVGVYSPHRDANGEIIGVVTSVRDITERKRAEMELRESEGKYRLLIENSGVAVTVIDNAGKFVLMNGMAAANLDGNPEDFVGKSLHDILPEDEADRHLERLQELIESGKGYSVEDFVDLPTGRRWFFTNTQPVVDSDGNISGVQTISQDITERKRMEEELLKVAKLESIGVLAGGIAHDLNNLLTGVMGNISLARLYENPVEKDRRLVEAEKASMQIKNLTQQLLTFSKGGSPILQTADIGELLRNSSGFSLSGSNVRCDLSIPDDLWPVEVDEGQINQVVNNLIINAKQAMPGGGVISMRAENVNINAESGLPLEDGAYIKVSVEDSGMGIPAEHIQRIFDPFFSTKQEGSGLGLATTYSIIEKHNGHITVESRMEGGTTFYIYLPASPESVSLAERAEEEKPVAGTGRVLVMDDEEIIRELASDILISTGYTVTTATDGAEAIELYEESIESGNHFDAAVIDLTVPGGMGGKETIQRLLEIDPEAKAIVSSGYSNDPIMADFARYGFMGIVAKPYKTRELSEVVHKVITG